MQQQPRLRRFSPRLFVGFFFVLSTVFAQQDVTNYLTTDVAKVGTRLACRCGGCKNTVGDCPMLRCESSDPKRRRIFEMKKQGIADDAIVSTFVREEGIAALSSPLPLHLITWLATPVALLVGFWIYTSFVRKSRSTAQPLSVADRALIDRFQAHMDGELEEPPPTGKVRR